jgi:hypothetical protein
VIHKIQIESLYRAVRSSEAFRRFLRIVENVENEVEQEAALKYWRLLMNNDLAESKAKGLKNLSAATPRSAG